jgi:hypothetical protein
MALSPVCTCLSCPAHRGAVAGAAAPAGVAAAGPGGLFAAARELFESVAGWLGGPLAGGLDHGGLEDRLAAGTRELARLLLQGHLDLRAAREERAGAVTGSDGVRRTRVEAGHQRVLATVFGQVRVTRMAYRAPGTANLHPADGLLNLPAGRHSHGLQRLAAIEAARGSFDGAVAAIARATGQKLGKRQAEELAAAAAADFGEFCRTRQAPPAGPADVLVLSADGKGIVMRPDALRPATAAAAARAAAAATRLPAADKPNRRRMAEIGAVYDATPAPRHPGDILPASGGEHRPARAGPRAAGKWLTASITASAAAVISEIFAEAGRRDPALQRTWIALVDGDRHQIRRFRAEARARQVSLTIIIDFVHVLEYLWKAAGCLHHDSDPAAPAWVRDHALTILCGYSDKAARAIRRAAASLPPDRRAPALTAAAYLDSKRDYLDYLTALENGWPIATGVIEGACRHLVQDRMDITGARWGLPGAEAILQLRALHANSEFDNYWHYHLTREHQRNHRSRYHNDTSPKAA